MVQNFDDFFNAKPVVQEQQTQQLTEFRPTPKKGQNGEYKAVVRFLPNPADPANKSIVTKYHVYLKHPVSKVGMDIDCPSTIGQPDAIQNTFFTLRNSSNPVLQENAKQFSRKQQSASLVQVISCESEPALVNKILVWKYGAKLSEKINAEMNPPMGEGHNPFNLFSGRPFAVRVKEVGGFPNYDACQFFDLAVEQSGMRIVTNNAQGQQQVSVVTPATIATEQGKAMVFNYLKDNAPDMEKYEYHPWTTEQSDFVNECIRIYSNPQATIQAMSAAQNPAGTTVASQPMVAQTATNPVPQMSAPQMPTMDLGSNAVTQTAPTGFQGVGLPDVDNILNQSSEPKKTSPTMALDLNDVLNGQIIG